MSKFNVVDSLFKGLDVPTKTEKIKNEHIVIQQHSEVHSHIHHTGHESYFITVNSFKCSVKSFCVCDLLSVRQVTDTQCTPGRTSGYTAVAIRFVTC